MIGDQVSLKVLHFQSSDAIRKRLGTNIGDEKIKNLVRFKLNNSNRALFTATSGKSSFVSLDPPNFPVVDSDGSSSSEADNEF